MSHFTVLVVGEEWEKQLAPFQENNMGDCPKEFLKFNDIEEENLQEYENDSTDEFYCNSGSSQGLQITELFYSHLRNIKKFDPRILTFNSDIYLKDTYRSLNKNSYYQCNYNDESIWIHILDILDNTNDSIDENHCINGIIRIEVVDPPKETPLKQKYSTFEEFMAEYCGYKERDPEMNRYGYWENPNRKWDWYSLGGRWTGFFKLKEGSIGELGVSGAFGNKPKDGHVDQALKKDIDFEGMFFDAYNKALEEYDKVASCFPDNKIPKIEFTWEQAWEKMEKEDKDFNSDKVRALYHNQKSVKLFKDIQRKNSEIISPFDSLDDYQGLREDYAEDAASSRGTTFAVIKDGQWFERGEMGWWGSVSNEKDTETWNKEFKKLLDSLSGDTLLSVVDCHI